MNEHLKKAELHLTSNATAEKNLVERNLHTALWQIIRWATEIELTDINRRLVRLESQAAQTAESPEEVDWENFSVLEKRVAILEGLHLEDLYPAQSTSSSSPDTLPPEAIPGTWSISFQSWCHANPNGTLTLSPLPVTLASRNLIRDLGPWLGAEIGVTLTSKGGTPLRGWPSPSTEEPNPSPSGAPGEDAAGIPPQAGREHIGVVGKERLFPSPLTVPEAARDPEFVTEPENWVMEVRDNSRGEWGVEIPPPNEPEGAASASSESSEPCNAYLFVDEVPGPRCVLLKGHEGFCSDAPTPEPTQDAQPSVEVWEVVVDRDYWPPLVAIKSGSRYIAEMVREPDAHHIVALHNEVVR